MGNLAPWWNINIDPSSVIITSYITGISPYYNSSVVRTAKLYHVQLRAAILKQCTGQGNIGKKASRTRHAGAEWWRAPSLESATAWVQMPYYTGAA